MVSTEPVNASLPVRMKSWLAVGLPAFFTSRDVKSAVANVNNAGALLLAELNFWQA